MENFKQLPPEYGPYEVGDGGTVRRLPKHTILKHCVSQLGYPMSMLSVRPNFKENHYTHKLVALMHVAGDTSLTVNHKNGIKTDNRADNLEWVTMSENQKHRHKLHPHLGALSAAQKSHPIYSIHPDGTKTRYPSATALQRLSGGKIRQAGIWMALKKGLTRYGLRWEYAAD